MDTLEKPVQSAPRKTMTNLEEKAYRKATDDFLDFVLEDSYGDPENQKVMTLVREFQKTLPVLS